MASGFVERSLLRKVIITAISVCMFTVALNSSAVAESDSEVKVRVIRGVAENWLAVANKQFERGFYRACQQSLSRAQDYEEYLTDSQAQNLNALAKKTTAILAAKNRVQEVMISAEQLMERGHLEEAKQQLEAIADFETVTAAERGRINAMLEKIAQKFADKKRLQRIAEFEEIYERSVELYEAGKLEKARKGFLEVARSGVEANGGGLPAEDYLLKIDGMLVDRLSLPSFEKKKEVAKEQPKVQKGGRGGILRSYVRAVVNDAVDKTESLLSQGEFEQARQAVESAWEVVVRNDDSLGETLFAQYGSELNGLSARIARREDGQSLRLEEQKRLEAEQAAQWRSEELARQKAAKIAELGEEAAALMADGKYEQAHQVLEEMMALKKGE